jgi:hypothetical protein
MCSLKTFHGLQPLARYDAKHHKFTSIVDVCVTSKEELVVDRKHKK